jgi:hypothetical protein
MIGSFRWRWARSGAVSSLLLAAFGMLSAAEARAGCIHPWVRDMTPAGALNDLQVLEDFGVSRWEHRPAPADRGDRSPCARGACSPAPMVPLSTPDSTPRRLELWGLTASDAIVAPPRGFREVTSPPCGRPLSTTRRLERPPR